jgi:hypothetical protein
LDWRCFEGEGVLREIIEGRLKGRRPEGRKIIGMLHELYEGEAYERMKRA